MSQVATQEQINRANVAAMAVARLSPTQIEGVLDAMAEALWEQRASILEENQRDMEAGKSHISSVMLDRLRLDEERIQGMVEGIRQVRALPSPVGRCLSSRTREDGLVMRKIACPMGTIAIIYESRPNVTTDAAVLALRAGSSCILRCGKEAHGSAQAIVSALHHGMERGGLTPDAVTLIEDISRESAVALMKAKGKVDLLIPRGGKALISTCVEQAIVPVLETGTGVCHGFVDVEADQGKALSVVENAKTSRPSVCNAMEVCLLHRGIQAEFLPRLIQRLGQERLDQGLEPVHFLLSPEHLPYMKDINPSLWTIEEQERDYHREFLDFTLLIASVDDVQEAVTHINTHSSGHSEAILTQNQDTADYFASFVDSAAVYINASTRFTDGGEFGLGCEMGISTQKLQARGPVGLEELCTYKYVLIGDGHIR